MWSSDPDFDFEAMIAAARSAPPPTSNTGVEITPPDDETPSKPADDATLPAGGMTVKVDWLSGTTHSDLSNVLACCAELTGASPVSFDYGQNGYRASYKVGVIWVYYDPGRAEIMVQLDGKATSALGFRKVRLLHNTLALRASRIDLAVDHCPFTPVLLRDQWLADNVRTRVKRYDREQVELQGFVLKPGGEKLRRHNWRSEPTGDTFYMGSRSSEKFARCYDSRGTNRFELELKGRRAAAAADHIFSLPEDEVPSAALGMIRDFVDFVDASASSNISRAPLLGFWADFVGSVERIKLDLTTVAVHSIKRALRWTVKQIAPVLAVVERIDDGSLLGRLINHGRDRWDLRHFDLLMESSAAECHSYLTELGVAWQGYDRVPAAAASHAALAVRASGAAARC